MSIFKVAREIAQIESRINRGDLESIGPKLDSLAGRITNDTLKEQYQTLCGRFHWAVVDREVDDIADSARRVCDAATRANLISRIKDVKKNHALSMESRGLIAMAEKCLKVDQVELPEVEFAETKAAELLFEMASDVFRSDLKKAFSLFNSLDDRLKEVVRHFVEEIGGSLDDLVERNSYDNMIRVVQGLVGCSYRLSGANAFYPSVDEVIELTDEIE